MNIRIEDGKALRKKIEEVQTSICDAIREAKEGGTFGAGEITLLHEAKEELHRAWKAVNRSTEMVRSVLYPGESESEADEKDIALLRRDTVKAIRERYAEIAAIARLNRIPDQCLAQAMELDWSVEQFCQETERFMKPQLV